MTTPENSDQPADQRVTRPEPARTAPLRKGATGAPAQPPHDAATHAHGDGHPAGVRDPDVLKVNEAVASTVRSAYDVLSETVAQGRKAAEQFRVGAYNVRDVPEDVRHMAGNLLGLARQLSSATFDICEALLRQTDGAMTPPPPGTTHVPPFQPPKAESTAPKAAPAAAPAPANEIELTMRIEGHDSALAHSHTLARPATPTAAHQFACDGLTLRGGTAPAITGVAFDPHHSGQGLVVTITVPPGRPAGVYVGAVYCATQPLPLGQLVIELT
ncbi:hypothetical protein [Novosphingobium sp.]|uniref:hypothetical protein n=1 Tax=Novosphingobium sp. TaxID=1874826 RepID=UPI003BAA5F0E